MALKVNVNKSTEEMDTQFNTELESVLDGKYPLDDFLADWDMTFEELMGENLGYPVEKELMRQIGAEGVYQSKNLLDLIVPPAHAGDDVPNYEQMFHPDFEVLGDKAGVNPDDLSIMEKADAGSAMMENKLLELGVPAALVTTVMATLTKGKSLSKKGLFGNKLFASKNLKKNQKENRGAVAPVVQGASRSAKGTNLRPSIKQKTADRYKSRADRVKQKNAIKSGVAVGGAALVGGAINNSLDRGLTGNRDKDGSLKVAGAPKPEVESENQFGYHKQEGQNFWTIDDSDSYWQTHDKEGSSAFEEAPLKEQAQEEFDSDYWFKQEPQTQQKPTQELDWDFWFKQ